MTFLWSKTHVFLLKHHQTIYFGVFKRKTTSEEHANSLWKNATFSTKIKSHFCALKSLVSYLKHHQTLYLGVLKRKTFFEENANF